MTRVDASSAGAGSMEIIVSVDGRNVPNYVQSEGNAKFKVTFTPQEPKVHMISVKFNDEPVPGSPMVCKVSDTVACVASGDGLAVANVNEAASFLVCASKYSGDDCNVIITGT
ncbi:unnamed protein product [Soboliphyme baturini]|uniref:Filamin-A n=1 Tax=Soboliphyme baturini TaxID=241478 RepID=A0A183JB05_9BILA|nr:unnamed protein product [Soboliphyme baturini]